MKKEKARYPFKRKRNSVAPKVDVEQKADATVTEEERVESDTDSREFPSESIVNDMESAGAEGGPVDADKIEEYK